MNSSALKRKKAAKKGIWKSIQNFCYDKRFYFLIFFLPAAIMFAAYAFFKVKPFGDNSVLVLDLNGQYVYYYEAFRDAFWGDGSFIYDWSRNLSGEMFGIFAYYLASPFMLIICLLPRTCMVTSIMIMQLAKIGTSAVTFAYFLKYTFKDKKKIRPASLVIFSTMYALMEYMVVQCMDPMWLDGLVYLPLIFVGVQKLVSKGNMIPYIIPLALMFIAHFYIGYMVGISTFLYFCYFCFTKDKKFDIKKSLKSFFDFGVGTLIALMCSAFVLLPVYNSLKLGKFEFTEPDFSLATQFDFLTFFTKMFPMTYDTVYPEGLPMIFCGTAALILVPLYFLNSKIDIKTKVSTGVLTGAFIILMYIKPVDMAMHGFQVPNWLPYRYSFIFSFFVIYMAFCAFENLDGIKIKSMGNIVFALMVFLFWCERENYKHFKLFETREVDDPEKAHNVIQGIWCAMICLLLYFLILYFIRKYPKSKVAAISMAAVLSIELFANAADTLVKIDKDVAYSKATSYEPYMSDLRSAVKYIKDYDKDNFYRMEATFHRTVNDSIAVGYYGVSHSSSTMNAPALSMLHQLGYAYGGHYTKYDGTTFINDALFDIRYLMNKTGDTAYVGERVKVPAEYQLATSKKIGKTNFEYYRNPNALGLGVVVGNNVTNIVLNNNTDPFINQNMVMDTLAGNNTQYFTRLNVTDTEMENCSAEVQGDGHTKYHPTDENNAECHVDYVVKMDKDSYLYMYLPTQYERTCNVWIQDESEYKPDANNMTYAGQFFVGDNYSILNLGKYSKDQSLRVRITIANDEKEAFWKDQLFYTFDYDTFTNDCQQLKTRSFNVTKFEDTYLEGTVNAEANNQVLFTTIPYENGWTIKVNGKKVEPLKSLNSLITIPLEPGENKITMKFLPDYFVFSIIITGCGILLLILVFLFEYKKNWLIKKFVGSSKDDVNNDSDNSDDEISIPIEQVDLNNKITADDEIDNIFQKMTEIQNNTDADDNKDSNSES